MTKEKSYKILLQKSIYVYSMINNQHIFILLQEIILP